MIKLSKEQILEFLAELVAPVSPEIFAGFGSEFQRNRYEWEKQNQEIEKEEEYISAWIEEQEVTHTLDILLEIANNPPEGNFYDGIAQRRQLDWEYYLALITTIRNSPGYCRPPGFVSQSGDFAAFNFARNSGKG
jgi:hypothetical protein